MSEISELERAFDDLDATPSFRARPDPVPADLRLAWRFAALPLILERCRGKSASDEQVHLLVSALHSYSLQAQILRALSGEIRPNDIPLRWDPALSRTTALLQASSVLSRRKNGNLHLENPGVLFARRLWADNDVMTVEKAFLNRLPKSLTQTSLAPLLGRR